MRILYMAILALAAGGSLCGSAAAQHPTVSTGLQTGSNSSFEQIGVDFGFRTGNFFFQQNSFGLATPQFGGATPGAGANLGFTVPIRGGEAFFDISASQGSRSSLVSQTPSATLANGVQGGLFDVTQTPFVTSLSSNGEVSPALERWQQMHDAGPAVPPTSSPPHRKADLAVAAGSAPSGSHAGGSEAASTTPSSAERPALSVAELRALRAQQSQQAQQAVQREIQALVERARRAEQAGKPSVARLYYEQAARRSSGEQRDQLLTHSRRLAESVGLQPAARSSAARQ